jgi:hypothetical protein
MKNQLSSRDTRIAALYLTMPGARVPPTEDGWYLWGEVCDSDEWLFCAKIIDAIDEAMKGGES